MKREFNMSFKQDIIKGKVKVVTDCGEPAEIVKWNCKGNYPILAVIDDGDTSDTCFYDVEGLSSSKKERIYVLTDEPESEDERIRKELMEFVKSRGGFKQEYIAWLEKQVPINEEAEKEKNDYVSGQFLYCKGSFNEFKEGESYWIEYIGNDTYIGRSDNILNQKFHITPRQLYTWLDPRHPEKQDEQKPQKKSALEAAKEEKVDNQNCVKPADKVEAKFKVGDWVVSKFGDIWHIDSFDKNNYQVSNDNAYNYFPISKQNEMHLWTIQEAKDGDILFAKGSYFKEYIFIYSGMTEDNVMSTYCGFDMVHNNFDTKLNRFGRMEDFETVYPATKEQRDTLEKAMKEAGYEWDAEKKELKKIERKPAWSEEDEKILKEIITDVKFEGYNNDMQADSYKKINWLKNLRGRVQPQPQQEWSEEDAIILNGCINYFKKILDKENNADLRACFRKNINWLQSIRPNHWKPSELQLECLDDAIKHYQLNGSRPVILIELLEELKKL